MAAPVYFVRAGESSCPTHCSRKMMRLAPRTRIATNLDLLRGLKGDAADPISAYSTI